MEGFWSFSELFELQTVERTFSREVGSDFERTVIVEAVLGPLSRHRHMLSVGTVADEEAVPWSGKLLSSA